MKYLLNFTISNRLYSILLLVIASVLWSSSGLFIKWINWHPLAIAGVRSIIAAVIIRTAFRHSKVQWNFNQILGAVAYAATVTTFVVATKLTTAANAILLQYTAPIYVALLGPFLLHEKPKLYDWLTIAVVASGMLLFFQEKMSAGDLSGNLLAIVSGLCMALMIISLRYQKNASPFGSVFLGNLITFFFGLPFMFESSPGLPGWVALLALGCFQLGLSYVLYSIAIQYVTALEASLITVLEPILNPIWVFLFLGEIPSLLSLLGGGIILLAITIRYIVPVLKPAAKVLSDNS